MQINHSNPPCHSVVMASWCRFSPASATIAVSQYSVRSENKQAYVTGAGHPQIIQPQMTGGAYSVSTPTLSPQGYAPQQGFMGQPQQAPVNFAPPPVQFHSAIPLSNLGQGAAPTDCPMCRQRAMTVATPQVGNTTQYVHNDLLRCSMSYSTALPPTQHVGPGGLSPSRPWMCSLLYFGNQRCFA